MSRRVGICAVAQTPFKRDYWEERFQGMALIVLESLLEQTGLKFDETNGIQASISVSDDIFDARTISNNAMTDVLGAHFGCEEKVAQEGAQALYYALAMIQSGHVDTVLVLGHCKESQGQSRNMVTHMAFDPFYTRPVGLDFQAAAGLQAQAYLQKSGIREDQLARIVVRARNNAKRFPLPLEIDPVDPSEVQNSPMLADPIRSLHAYPVTDGAIGMIVAAEEQARAICPNPVWITGVGNCMDSFFLGDRDITSNFALKQALQRACRRAEIDRPQDAFDVVELSDLYAYQLPLWCEGIGLCPENRAQDWLDADGLDNHRVNLSGGTLAGSPLILGGLSRAASVVLQLMGKAGDAQIDGARRGLAHGVMGPAGQFHTVLVLERDGSGR
uniref:Thiolase family protein n=1 Tax=Desulfatirhabdium butyrativorans TaxID=340467 RepID=A0A7C4VRY3_9BACT